MFGNLALWKARKQWLYMLLSVYTPSDPTATMTTMIETKKNNKCYCSKVHDIHLWSAVLETLIDFKWFYPEFFPSFIPRLGGMHLLSFIGCIVTLMANSGLKENRNKTFPIVKKILKKFQMNLQPWGWYSKNCCKMTFRKYVTLTNYQALLMIF